MHNTDRPNSQISFLVTFAALGVPFTLFSSADDYVWIALFGAVACFLAEFITNRRPALNAPLRQIFASTGVSAVAGAVIIGLAFVCRFVLLNTPADINGMPHSTQSLIAIAIKVGAVTFFTVAVVLFFYREIIPRDYRWIVIGGAIYFICMSCVLGLTVGIFRPCETNFEGGCGYGKLWAAIISFLGAFASFGIASSYYGACSKSMKSTALRRIVLGAIAIPAVYLTLMVGMLIYGLV
jgi:hypothetical protein